MADSTKPINHWETAPGCIPVSIIRVGGPLREAHPHLKDKKSTEDSHMHIIDLMYHSTTRKDASISLKSALP